MDKPGFVDARLTRLESDVNECLGFIKMYRELGETDRIERAMASITSMRKVLSAVESKVMELERGEPLVAPGMFVPNADFEAYQRVIAGFLAQGYVVKLCRVTSGGV